MHARLLLTVSVSALLAGLGLTACSAGQPKTSGPATAVSQPADPTPGGSTTPTFDPPTNATTPSTGSGSPQAQAAKCRTQDLKWTLTVFPGPSLTEDEYAELVAVNPSSHACTLAGYPKLAFHQGRGPKADGVGKGSPAPLALGAGSKAVIALHYAQFNGKGGDCGNSTADVTAPGDTTTVRVPVVDPRGKPAEVTICSNEVPMSPPAAR
jgi:hypothetical protein